MKTKVLLILVWAMAFVVRVAAQPDTRNQMGTMTADSIAAIENRYAAGERSPEFMNLYAQAYILKPAHTEAEFKGKYDKASERIQQWFLTLDDKVKASQNCRFVFEQYTSSSRQPAARWLIANVDKVDKSWAEKKMKQYYEDDITNYFIGKKAYDEKDYKALKKETRSLGLDERYTIMEKFIEAKAKGNMKSYMNFCKKNVALLDRDAQMLLFGNFATNVNQKDIIERVETAKFLRSLLPQLDIDVVYQTIGQIKELENVEP